MRKVVIYPGEDGHWIAEYSSLPGCLSQGKSKGEAVVNIEEAIEAFWAHVLKRSMSPKNPKTIDEAIIKLKDCRKREEAKYGRQVKELGRLSGEAPAPDPCVDAFNRLVQEIFDYGGEASELELGELREEVGRAMAVRRAVKNEARERE